MNLSTSGNVVSLAEMAKRDESNSVLITSLDGYACHIEIDVPPGRTVAFTPPPGTRWFTWWDEADRRGGVVVMEAENSPLDVMTL